MANNIHTRRRKTKPVLRSYCEGGYNWAVYFAGPDGKRLRRKFVNKGEAASFLADKQVEAENLGSQIAASLDDRLKREAVSAADLLRPFGKSIMEAATFYRSHLEATAKSAPLGDLAAQFLQAKEAEGKSTRYLEDLHHRVTRFVADNGGRFASEVTAKQISEWLAALEVGNLTRNHYRRVLSALFSWCWRMGYCAENPLTRVAKAKPQPSPIEVYSVKEMATLLRAAVKCGKLDILANIVICGFAGLRQSEFERLSWEQIRLDRGLIDLSAAMTKTAMRRIVKIRAPLAEWLASMPLPGKGAICGPSYQNRLSSFRRSLSMRWKPNALRHSFASYLMEALQNPGEISLQLGHSDAGIVFAHYRELVSTADTMVYWSMTPQMTQSMGPACEANSLLA